MSEVFNPALAVDLSKILNTEAEQKAKQLPDPKTFHLLCVVPEAMEEYAESDVGLVKSSKEIWKEEMLTSVLFVVKMGPDAYADKTRFPSGPSCKTGDFVVVRPNSGTDRKSTRLNSSHMSESRMPSSA